MDPAVEAAIGGHERCSVVCHIANTDCEHSGLIATEELGNIDVVLKVEAEIIIDFYTAILVIVIAANEAAECVERVRAFGKLKASIEAPAWSR